MLLWLFMVLNTAALWIGMWWLIGQIPHIDDLYNTVYNNSRPERPENATLFLFIFPSFCVALSIATPIFALTAHKNNDGGLRAKLTFALCVYLFFSCQRSAIL